MITMMKKLGLLLFFCLPIIGFASDFQYPVSAIPEDLKKALETSPKAGALWNDITPLARWDWIRWIRAVKTEETRQNHIEVALDKLNKGMRRPCCFNRNLCSEPYVSHNWKLLEPEQVM